MFFRDDGVDKQLKRLSSRDSSFWSCSSISSTASSSDGNAAVSKAMIQSLIRDLSFWDAIPPSKAFPNPLPGRQPNKNHHREQSMLKRGRSGSSRESSARHPHHSSGSGSRETLTRQYSGGNKGTINEHHQPSWQPLPQPSWKAAVDPMTGRTYWYDAVTRRTQWEKPAEVRQMDKQKKSQRRKRDRLFFQEMEQNIVKSLARGEVVPGVPQAQLEPTGPPLEPRNAKIPLNARSVRTLSRMDDTILAELRDDVVSPEEFNRAIQAQRTKTQPRSSSRGRPPLPGATRSFSSKEDRSRSRSRSQRQGLDARESQASQQPQPVKPMTTNNNNTGPRLPPARSSSSPSNGLENPVNNKAPPPRTLLAGEGVDALAGEHLLDGTARADMQAMTDKSDNINNKNHVRRNTGGTIYVNGTMSNPNVDATIKCVCGVYRAHLVQALDQRNANNKSPVSVMSKPLDIEIFNDRYHLPVSYKQKQDTIPSLTDIVEFYHEFFKKSQMEFDTIIMSLIYVERLIKTTNVTPGPENWRSVIFSCMVLASKVWDDLSMWNVDFSNVASAQSHGIALFTLKRVNQLELILLKSLNFDVRLPASEYAKYYFLIRTMLLRSGLLKGAAEPLGKVEAKGLENRTSQYQDSKLGADQRGRRTQSMYDYSWLEKSSQKQEGGDRSNSPPGGPVLKDQVCLEQIVNMSKQE